MDCDICAQGFNKRRKPICASCAQAGLYEQRILQASALLDRGKTHTHAEAVVRPGNDGVLAALPDDADFDAITSGITTHSYELAKAESESTQYRIGQIANVAGELKQQIEEHQQTIQAQSLDLVRRRKELAAKRAELDKTKLRAFDPVLATSRKMSQRLEKTRSKIVDARLLLCREAATASNLRKSRGTSRKSEYSLGGIIVPDLRELNVRTQHAGKPSSGSVRTVALSFELISEALDNVAHLVTICSHYLAVRLPAQLILPHENFPRAVIMPEKSSYKYGNIQFPAMSTSQSTSPTVSRVLDPNQPRPRPLWLDRPLSQLYKEDPKTYGLFIEGAVLLAWDIAWLCKTQGIEDIASFEDVCAIGKNLWRLLMTQHRRHPHRPLPDRTDNTDHERPDPNKEFLRLGMFSHVSAQHNLASFQGLDLLKDWKLATPARTIDKVKSYLASEISGAEWDLLEEREWDEEHNDEQPVLVGGSGRPQESKHAAMSIMTVAPHEGTEDEKASASEGKKKGNNGWMKVRGRSGEV